MAAGLEQILDHGVQVASNSSSTSPFMSSYPNTSLESAGPPPPAPLSLQGARPEELRAQAATAAKIELAKYLGSVRDRPGLVMMEALDTLLLHLLCEVG